MAQPSGNDVPIRGVNLAGAEFGGGHLPGLANKDYLYPSVTDIAKFAAIGMNAIRLPFLWERLQPDLNAPLSQMELGRIDAVVDAASLANVLVILDPHNYGNYRGDQIGSAAVPAAAYDSLWKQLASHYHDQPNVAFGLMNEPIKQDADAWADIAQGAIDAIRATGARQLILVPGTIYTGAHSWNNKVGKMSNAEAIARIKDPAKNFTVEVHQYFDSDSSGTKPSCVDEDVGAKALVGFTDWLRNTGNHGFLGEFGASKDPVCLGALRNTLDYIKQNGDVWTGWTYWGASDWFGTYMFNIMPPNPAEHAQVGVLEEFLPAPRAAYQPKP